MNSNLKNAAIGLIMIGSVSGAIFTLGYGINNKIKNTKTEVVTVDPQKAEEAIKKESFLSRTLFEVKQRLEKTFKSNSQEPEVINIDKNTVNSQIDMSELCNQIGEYYKQNNAALKELDSITRTDNPDINKAREIVANVELKANEIRTSFNNYSDANSLQEQFETFENNMQKLREQYLMCIENIQ